MIRRRTTTIAAILLASALLGGVWVASRATRGGLLSWIQSGLTADGPAAGQIPVLNSSRPKLQYSLGVVAPGSTTRYDFQIQNRSTTTWHARNIRTDCGCIVNRLNPEVIGPRSTGLLSVSYTAPDAEGRVDRRVTLSFAEPAAPVIDIWLLGAIRSEISLSPKELSLFDIVPGAVAAAHFEALVRNGRRVDWSRARSSLEWVRVGPVVEETGTDEVDDAPITLHHVSLEILPPERPLALAFDGELHFPLSDREGETVRLPFHLTLEKPVTLTPESLFFGYMQPGQAGTASVSVAARDPAKFHPPRLVLGDDLREQLSAELRELGPGIYSLDARLLLDRPGSIDSSLRLVGQDGTTVEISVMALCEEPRQ